MYVDKFNRKIKYVRLSITDRCNFRCIYCMGENTEFLPENALLSLEEIEKLVKTLKDMKIEKIRITGGEPTIRTDIIEIAKVINKYYSGFSITTNGAMLSNIVEDLKKYGLDSVNLSLDSLNEKNFLKITRRNMLKNTLEGLYKTLEIGVPVKLNTVVQKENFDEIHDLIEFSAKLKIPIRFIELMPIGTEYNEDEFVKEDEVKAKIQEKYTLEKIQKKFGYGPSNYYRIKELNSYVGFISAITHNFCSTCNKIRISSDGNIYPCLAFDYHVPIKDVINDEEKLKERIEFAISKKPKQHFLTELRKKTPMHKMGG
ncbi:hypothetical protein XO10_07395 [Marinitoga sp. 1135]|uniref:GTP 3',8-cyclase n=1 Tax=Marinitoga piezophila (strain DSM 14283 / JCM 11233 / KA3) TaxID=443254 RepID=H2J478_MARPK|nr:MULTISPECIES: GTP 3',8-cyclase MoaA [Marinitoga]AEX85893.1 molybdenum cofactor biosynthesis protein A [Marinitoga piezophila KA3]APT76326.1 hypothetical protein LN42_07975 [Marinitoga sp. 1137]NUU96098.1 hypothetical protein [Marinitoga sp. 1135]NUU98005.1 hypothetical protein [Marinitoga sp. 1138]